MSILLMDSIQITRVHEIVHLEECLLCHVPYSVSNLVPSTQTAALVLWRLSLSGFSLPENYGPEWRNRKVLEKKIPTVKIFKKATGTSVYS